MPIKLAKESEAFLVGSLKRYAAEELDLQLGDLKAKLLLAYVLKEIGPTVYNQAVADVQAVLQEKVADLGVDCFEPEFTFWKKG
jgi:uncharacterized protein (DUF2164 family)